MIQALNCSVSEHFGLHISEQFLCGGFNTLSVSPETVPGPPRNLYSGSSHCNSLVFWPHNQTTSPVIPFEVAGQRFFWRGWAEKQREKLLFWKAKGHQRSLAIEKNIHKRCSNARLGCIYQMFKNKIKIYFLLKLVRLFHMGYSVCDYWEFVQSRAETKLVFA